MPAKVKIEIDAKNNTGGVIKNAAKDLDGFSKSADKADVSITDLNSALSLVQQGFSALKKGYDFAREGAAIEFTGTKFERLAENIGTVSDALLGDLRTATRGTYSDMELMASAADLVGLGLTKTHDETVRLAAVSAGLNMDMNQLVLTLTNMTTMRFDALGVQVTGFDDKVKALEATGLSASDAFKEAFLQQAEEQLEKVGNAADSSLGSFMRLEAQTKNLTNALKMMAGDALAPVIDKQLDYQERIQLGNELMARFNGTVALSRAEHRKYADDMDALVNEYIRAEQYGAAWSKVLKSNAVEVQAANEIVTMSADEFKEKMGALGELLKGPVGKAQDEYNAKIAEYTKQLELAKTQKEKDTINENIAAETAAYKERAEAIIFNIQQEAIMNSTMANEDKIAMIATLAQGYGMIDEATAQAMVSTQGYVDAVEDGSMAQETAISYMRGTAVAMTRVDNIATDLAEPIMHMGTLAENSAEKFGIMKEKQSELAQGLESEAQPAIGGTKSAWQSLLGMPDEWTATINIITNGSFPNLPTKEEGGYCFLAGTPITMADASYRNVENLRIGDAVLSYDHENKDVTIGYIRAVMVRDTKDYYQINGIRVTGEHPFWSVTRKSWVKACDLVMDEKLQGEDGVPVPVKSVTRVFVPATVYNIEVDTYHNYYAGGVLVHNKEAEQFAQVGRAVYAGNPYMVGEAGMEPFIPATNGRILGHAESLHALQMGGGGGTMNIYGPVTLTVGEGGDGGLMAMR